jgi:putative two-component system response regulator
MVSLLESVIDCHDPETYDHVRRVSSFAAALARAAGLDDFAKRKIFVFSSLHDLGKIGIPQSILEKPAALDGEETTLMRTHVTIGARLVEGLDPDPILHDTILYHHERWDGGGYPEGLAGEDIPLSARIVAIADVFDALLADRPYKEAIDFEAAAGIVLEGRGSQFDPGLVDAFVANLDVMREIAMESPTKAIGFSDEIFGASGPRG